MKPTLKNDSGIDIYSQVDLTDLTKSLTLFRPRYIPKAKETSKYSAKRTLIVERKSTLYYTVGTVSKEISRCECQYGVTRG